MKKYMILLSILIPCIVLADFEITNTSGNTSYTTTYKDDGSTSFGSTTKYDSGTTISNTQNTRGGSNLSISRTYGDTTIKTTYGDSDSDYDYDSGYDY